MKITRLQLIVALLGVLFLIFGLSTWLKQRAKNRVDMAVERAHTQEAMQQRREPSATTPAVNVTQEEAAAAARLRRNARQTIAIVGEAYQPLRRRDGEIAQIADPLRAAKTYLAENKPEQSMESAKVAWKALKAYRNGERTPAAVTASIEDRENPVPGVYTVTKGDTLWRIAVTQSPFHQGPGWVTIWKANKEQINDFDRVETGTQLHIPTDPKAYILPYWRPRALR